MENQEIVKTLNEFQNAFRTALCKIQDGTSTFKDGNFIDISEMTCTFLAPFSTNAVETLNFITECGSEFTEKFYNLLDEIYGQICQEKNLDMQDFENYEDLRDSKDFQEATIVATKARFEQVSIGISVFVKGYHAQGPYFVKIASFINGNNPNGIKEGCSYIMESKIVTNIEEIKSLLYKNFHCKEYLPQAEETESPGLAN